MKFVVIALRLWVAEFRLALTRWRARLNRKLKDWITGQRHLPLI